MPSLSTLLYILLAFDAVIFAGGIAFVFLSPKSDLAGEGMKWLLPIMLAVPLILAGLLALLGFLWDGFRIAGIIVAATPLAFGVFGMLSAPFSIIAERRAGDPVRTVAEGFAVGPARDLARAMMRSDEAEARRLLDATPIDIAAADEDRNTLFMVAVAHMPALVPLLVQRGADPNFTPPGGDPPIFTALRGAEPTVALLLDQGADPNARDRHGSPILGTALLVQRDDAAAALIARGADIHARDADNWSALMYAVAYRRWAMAEQLIQRGVDLSEPRGDGETLAQMFERAVAEAPGEERPAIDRVVATAAARGASLR